MHVIFFSIRALKILNIIILNSLSDNVNICVISGFGFDGCWHSFWLQCLLQMSKSQLWLSGFTCVSKFWSGGLPWSIRSLRGLRKAFGFQFFQLLLVVAMGVMTSKLFTWGSWNQKQQCHFCLGVLKPSENLTCLTHSSH